MELSRSLGVVLRPAMRQLEGNRDKAKLKWWYKLATLPDDRYPKQLFNQQKNIKPRRGRKRKVWGRMVDDLFKFLDIAKGEWLDDIKRGDSSSESFLACVEECISERESWRFEEELHTKVKLDSYKWFGKSVEFKKYLPGVAYRANYRTPNVLKVRSLSKSTPRT